MVLNLLRLLMTRRFGGARNFSLSRAASKCGVLCRVRVLSSFGAEVLDPSIIDPIAVVCHRKLVRSHVLFVCILALYT